MKYHLISIGLLAAFQNTQAGDQLDPIIVSAARTESISVQTSASVNVITHDEILASGAKNLGDLLRGRAGIHITDLYGNGSNMSIDMRGFGNTASSNTLVMVDGRKLNPSSDIGSLYFNSLDMDRIERIEIIQGSTGVLFGNQSVGGTINIITRKADYFEANISGGVGSYSGNEVSAHVSDRDETTGFGYSIQGRRFRSDSYRDHNDLELDSYGLILDYQHESGYLAISHRSFDEYQDTPGALFLEEIDADRRQATSDFLNDFLDTESQVTRLTLHHDFNDSWRLETEVSYRDDDRDFVQSFRNFSSPETTQDREVWDITPRLIGSFGSKAGDIHVTLGIDYQDTDYYLLSAFGPQSNDQQIEAVYGQIITPLSEQTELSLGARHAQVENEFLPGIDDIDDDVTIGSLGLVYSPNDQWRFFTRADQNYRFAKVDEHTNTIFGQPTGLDTQTGVTYEAGVSYKDKNIDGELLIYRIDLEDEIHFDASGFFNINLDDTRRHGLLLQLNTYVTDNIAIGGSYNYVDSEITSGPFDGNAIPSVPEHKARLYAEIMPGMESLILIEGIYVDEQFYGGDFSNQFPEMDDYFILNLNARYDEDNWSINLRINNLLNEKYSESGNIGFDNIPHQSCSGPDFFGSYRCPSENPSPEINAWLDLEYRFE